MTNTGLVEKLRALIDDAGDADKKHIKKIRKVLHKLKERQHELRDRLETIDDPELRQKVEQEIAVIKLQRGKGVEVYKELKNARKDRKKKNPDAAKAAGPVS